VEYTAPSDDYPGGLKVRFRQLDADSKAVLRRALEVRRHAYAAAMEAAAAEAPKAEEAAPEPPPPAVVAPGAPPAVVEAPPRAVHPSTPPRPRVAERRRSTRVVAAPPNRDALLGRLRDRARTTAGAYQTK